MSANKYANLPDIDTAPDIYETEDVVFPSQNHESSSDDEAMPTRSTRNKASEGANSQELDVGHLMDAEEASKKFRKAEKRKLRSRTRYAYPPSPTHSDSSSAEEETSRPIPLSRRLKSLQSELALLESELADPANPLLEESAVDPGEMLRGLVDVRGRLEKIKQGTEGRGKLVNVILGHQSGSTTPLNKTEPVNGKDMMNEKAMTGDIRNLVDMDKRVAELEKLVGTSTTAVDEDSPLPLPLAVQISRIHYQLHALTTPRHIDNISRRLKLLMSELDRASNAQQAHRRHPSQSDAKSSDSNTNVKLPNDIIPILHRLNPALPQIPHILTRLRTLSTLHASAGEFQKALESLEDEQARVKESLNDLENAVGTVEISMEENRKIVSGNVEGLENRVTDLFRRLDELDRSG
ncbi:Dynamitin-domain-containing protein [Rhodocollybia butyracea]|uniref:Dynamitin-domain-containing protein n=1 Tax=Rhodocollybia butyracea TaxID=206335 RepID=A0A9P5U9L9_9AGAR|nr:Dynamitin-domain-containing protein [Rhodocollybia butyracea]